MLEKNSSIVFNKNSEDRRKRRSRVFFVSLLFIIFLTVVCIAILRRPELQITQYQIIGAQSLGEEELKSFITHQLSGNQWLVIPKTNNLFFSKNKLITSLKNQFPALARVEIIFETKNKIVLKITEKEPEFIWCKDTACYFMDQEGVLFRRSPQFDPGVYLLFYGGAVDTQNPLRQSFITKELLSSIVITVNELKKQGVVVHTIALEPDGFVSLGLSMFNQVRLLPKSKLLVTKAFFTEPSGREALALLGEDDGFMNTLKQSPRNLDTIDLRFDGKIYYTFNDGQKLLEKTQ